ncbi:MAG: pilus assembly protein TadG-related protein [Actinomycetota bacterium]
MSRGRRDRGQALPWMMVVIIAAMALIVFAVRFATVVDDAARARTAADAAALAGAAAGEPAARELAERNGATLVEFVRTGRGVLVEVRVGAVRARAQASASTVWVRSSG